MPHPKYLEMEVRLPSGNKQMVVDWIDTAGEVWDRNLQKDGPEIWNQFLQTLRNSEGLLLILPPHRGMDLQPGIDVEQFVT
jgi:hypothetical protein